MIMCRNTGSPFVLRSYGGEKISACINQAMLNDLPILINSLSEAREIIRYIDDLDEDINVNFLLSTNSLRGVIKMTKNE